MDGDAVYREVAPVRDAIARAFERGARKFARFGVEARGSTCAGMILSFR